MTTHGQSILLSLSHLKYCYYYLCWGHIFSCWEVRELFQSVFWDFRRRVWLWYAWPLWYLVWYQHRTLASASDWLGPSSLGVASIATMCLFQPWSIVMVYHQHQLCIYIFRVCPGVGTDLDSCHMVMRRLDFYVNLECTPKRWVVLLTKYYISCLQNSLL